MEEITISSPDLLDNIVFKYYGSIDPLVDVLQFNRGLAKLGPLLPAGTVIKLPTFESISTQESKEVSLWD